MPVLRPLLAAGLIALTLPTAAAAKPSLWDLFTPERIVTRLVQFGISALRTQFDLVYGGISVSPLTGTVTLTDVRAWPAPPWDSDGACVVDIARLTIRTAAVDEPDIARLKAQASGVTAPAACLPPEAQGATGMLGIDNMELSRLTADIDYRISSAALNAHVFAKAEDLAAVSLLLDLDYFALDGRQDMDNPKPVIYLRDARLTVEDLGLWTKVQPMVPPPFSDPASAGSALPAMLDGMIPPAGPAADALKSSVTEAWLAFLANPKLLVIETGFDPASPVYIDPDSFESGPEALLSVLQPVATTHAAPVRGLLPSALLTKAVDQMTDDEKRSVGIARASGIGAPRDLAVARSLLGPLADAGDGDAAAALARALEFRAPSEAYGYALTASASGAEGSGALLDRIEGGLEFGTVLIEQSKKVQGVQHPAEALESIALVRAEASKRLTGRGETRSYATAALWALIGKAAGDAESADILEEIDEKVRLAGPDSLPTWEEQEAAAAELASQAWIGFDLPNAFAN